jgi:replicative DNA helicase
MNDATECTSLEAEESLVSCLFFDPTIATNLSTLIDASDFSDRRTSTIYGQIQNLIDAGKPGYDLKVLVPHLRGLGLLEKAGGVAYIGKLLGEGIVSNWEFYADEVSRLSKLRHLIKVCQSAIERATVPRGEKLATAANVSAWIDAKLSNVKVEKEQYGTSLRDEGIKKTGLILSGDDVELEKANGRIVMTGIEAIDVIHGGFRSGQNIVIAALTGKGKSALAKQIANHVGLGGGRVLYISLEMTTTEIADRVWAERARINSKHINNGRMDDTEKSRFIDEVEKEKLDNFIIAAPQGKDATWSRIAAYAKLINAEGQLDLVVIDYVQLMEKADPRQTDYEKVTEVSHGCKQLARSLDCTVLTLSQLSEEKNKPRKPVLRDLRDSPALGHDADVVVMLHEIEEGRSDYELIVAKWRGDNRGTYGVLFERPYTRFIDAPEEAFT